MEIIVEDARVEMDLPKEGVRLCDVVDEVEQYLFTVGRVPTALTIDGHSLSQDELESRQEDVLSGRETIEFGVIPVVEFVASNLEGVENANAELLKKLRTFADQIYRNQSAEDSNSLVSELAQFFDFWLKMRALLPQYFEELVIEGKSLSVQFDELHSVLEESLGAMEDKDFVLAADLFQYEIIPCVERVHEAIPQLKQNLLRNG